MTEKQKAVHTIPFKQWLKEQIPAGMSDIQLPYIEEHLQGKTFTRSYSRKEGEEIRYVYDMTPVDYVRAWVCEVYKNNKRLLEYGLQVCDDFEKGLLQVYDLPGKLRGYIEDYMEEVCIEDSPLDNPVWYMSSLLSYSLRFKVAAAVAEDGIKEDVTPTEFCLWARAMNLYINASGAALIETREAILQVIHGQKKNAERQQPPSLNLAKKAGATRWEELAVRLKGKTIEYKHIDDDSFKTIQAEKIFSRLRSDQYHLFISIAQGKGECIDNQGSNMDATLSRLNARLKKAFGLSENPFSRAGKAFFSKIGKLWLHRT